MTSRDSSELALDGFAYANAESIVRVPGGVTARDITPGRTRVVIGGGAGHFPAFAGFVGPGIADAAVAGGVFASPSKARIIDVTSRLPLEQGALLLFGHYTGDLLNFGAAATKLSEDGYDVRVLPITDDIASADADHAEDRRGIAGDLIVAKVAGAAAAAGGDIDAVEAAARKANLHTSSLGVAFSSCTLPGADSPLFSLEPGMMGIGMGIHGEAGISVEPQEPPAVVLERLIDAVVADLNTRIGPVAGARAALVVNGLGGMPAEHVLTVGAQAVEALAARGATVVRPLIGDFCTSYDMNGFSVTVTLLDADLEKWWLAPAQTTVMGNGSRAAVNAAIQVHHATPAAPAAADKPTGTRDPGAAFVVHVFEQVLDVTERREALWGDLDAVAGDGDHGIGMMQGVLGAVRSAVEAADGGEDAATTVAAAARGWGDNAGGTSGMIWEAMIEAALRAYQAKPGDAGAIDAVAAAASAITTTGGAVEGDKTLLDAAAPFAAALADAYRTSGDLAQAWSQALQAAVAGRDRTATYGAKRGRARTHADASIGTPDPGAVSLTHILERIGTVIAALPRKDSSHE